MPYYLRTVIACFVMGLFANPASAQGYPTWISDMYCAERADPAECASYLTVESLNDGGGEGDLPQLAICEYDHPTKDWDYKEECYYTGRANAFAYVRSYRTRSGYSVGVTSVAVDSDWGKSGDILFNELQATTIPSGANGTCVETFKSGEVFCTYSTESGPSETVTETIGASKFCSFKETETVLLSGTCAEKQICTVDPDVGEAVCSYEYIWGDGRQTTIETAEDNVELIDDHLAGLINGYPSYWELEVEKCVLDDVSKQTFCFSDELQQVHEKPLAFSDFPALLDWLGEGGSKEDSGLLFDAIGSKNRMASMLDDPTNTNINIVAAIFSAASYLPSSVVQELFETLGFTTIYIDIDFHTQDEDSMMFQYVNATGKKFLFWAMTGSEGNKIFWQSADWAQNINLGLSQIPPMIVRGKDVAIKGKVLTSLSKKSDFIFTTMYTVIRLNPNVELSDTTIVVTGHSQGGMIASILSAMLSEYLQEKQLSSDIRLITFGSPGIGDQEFANTYAGSVLASHWINKYDIMPYLFDNPPERLINDLIRVGRPFKRTLTTSRFGTENEFRRNIIWTGLAAEHDMLRIYLDNLIKK